MMKTKPNLVPSWIVFAFSLTGSLACLLPALTASADDHLVERIPLGSMTAEQINGVRAQQQIQQVLGSALSGVDFFKIRYRTSDGLGGETIASGLEIVPKGATAQSPLVAFQHGTKVIKTDVPSNGPTSPDTQVLALTFAGQGFVVTSADYLGLGDNEGIHPYLDAATEASAGIDLVSAAQEGTDQYGKGHVYVSGYSQGGQAAMAMYRELETHPRANIDVRAAAPAAGPYDTDGVSVNAAFANTPSTVSNVFISYFLVGLTRGGPISAFQNLEEVTADGVAPQLRHLFDGVTPFDTIAATLPPTPRGILKTSVIADIEARDPNSALFRAFRANETFRWVPHHPIMLMHASGDHYVSFQNSMVAHDYFVAHGADSTLVDLGSALDHIQAFVPACIKATLWFKSMEPTTAK